MKTGFTDGSGYGLVATAKRDDRRMITVLAGPGIRRASAAPRASGCWSTAFASSRSTALFEPGAPVAEADVWQGVAPKVPLVVAETVGGHPLARGAQGSGREADYASPVPAPSWPARSVGHAEITAPGMAPMTVPLVAAERRRPRRHAGPGHRQPELPDLGRPGLLIGAA